MTKTFDGGYSITQYGAVGDGTLHEVREWLTGGALDRGYADLAAIQADYPKADTLDYSIDEAAWDMAMEMVPEHQTLLVPNGVYVKDGGNGGSSSWDVQRNHITIQFESITGAILRDLGSFSNGIRFSGYRRDGWDQSDAGHVTYTDMLEEGQGWIELRDPSDAAKYSVGETIMLVAGSSEQWDQENGEMNKVRAIIGDRLYLENNLQVDYSTGVATHNGRITAPFTVPAVGSNVTISCSFNGDSNLDYIPNPNAYISIGNDLYRVVSTIGSPNTNVDLVVTNMRATNSTGTITSAKLFKGRVIFRCTKTAENVHIIGGTVECSRQGYIFSNSYNCRVTDQVLKRSGSGSFWLDGDGGRKATLTRVKVYCAVPTTAQPARSFSEMELIHCEIHQGSIHFSEFNKNCSVIECKWYLAMNEAGTYLDYAPIGLGRTTAYMTARGNRIYVDGMEAAIDTFPDIQGYQAAPRRGMVIADNIISAQNVETMIRYDGGGNVEISGNKMNGSCDTIYSVTGTKVDELGLSNKVWLSDGRAHIHHNTFIGKCNAFNFGRPVNVDIHDNYSHMTDETISGGGSNSANGNIIWSSNLVLVDHECVKLYNNTFKNWRYRTTSYRYNYDLNPAVQIGPNLFIDPTDTKTLTFIDTQYPTT